MKLIDDFKELDFDQKIIVVLTASAAWLAITMFFVIAVGVTIDAAKSIKQINQVGCDNVES